MKILHISGASLKSGAGRGAYWLHLGLRELGVESHLLTTQAPERADNVYGILGRSEQIKQKKYLKKTKKRTDLFGLSSGSYFNFNSGVFKLDDLLRSYPADILHLHWIAGAFIDLKSIKRVDIPIIWTLRDMWPFTGGCHYSIDCTKYAEFCGSCPLFNNRLGLDPTKLNIWNKARSIGNKVTVVAISDWLAECAKRSPIFSNSMVNVIDNAIDDGKFQPTPKSQARSQLGLPDDKPIVISVSLDFDSPYKGYDLYWSALSQIPSSTFNRVYIGGNTKSVKDESGIIMGRIEEPEKLALYYSAADVAVVPSRQEAFGKTVAEAMACGTPVVAFDATGPGGMIEHKQTGYLARPFETIDLIQGIEWCVNEMRSSQEIGQNAIELTKKRFTKKVVSEKYMELYKTVVKLQNSVRE